MTERVRQESSSKGTMLGYTVTVTGTSEHGYSAPPDPLPWGAMVMGSTTKTTTDHVIDNHVSRLNKGEIINNPFRTQSFDYTYDQLGTYEHVYKKANGYLCPTHGYFHDQFTKHYGIWRPGHPGWIEMDSSLRASIRQNLINLSVTQAHANVDPSKMLALTTLAESEKTVDSVVNILRKVYKATKAARRLDAKQLQRFYKTLGRNAKARKYWARKSLKETTDAYMEARYAIRPLYYDMRNIVETVQASKTAGGRVRETFRGYAEDSGTITATKLTDVTLATYVKGDWNRRIDWKMSARAGVLCDIDVTYANLTGTDQIFESMWELVPFSFVVDWFVRTGDWIAAQTPNAGVRQLASWVTVKEEVATTCTLELPRSTADTAGYQKVSLKAPLTCNRREELVLERIIDPAISPLPPVSIRLDGYKITDLGIIISKLIKSG